MEQFRVVLKKVRSGYWVSLYRLTPTGWVLVDGKFEFKRSKKAARKLAELYASDTNSEIIIRGDGAKRS